VISPGSKLLRIYLGDHLAASKAGIQVAEHCLHQNQEGDLGNFLRLFLGEIRGERQTLKLILRAIGGTPSLGKQAAAWLLEKLSHLKLNGHFLKYSDLSRLFELESLLAGVQAKLDMWRILHMEREGLASFNLKALIEQGESQIAQLQKYCLRAGSQAFAQRNNEDPAPKTGSTKRGVSRTSSKRSIRQH